MAVGGGEEGSSQASAAGSAAWPPDSVASAGIQKWLCLLDKHGPHERTAESGGQTAGEAVRRHGWNLSCRTPGLGAVGHPSKRGRPSVSAARGPSLISHGPRRMLHAHRDPWEQTRGRGLQGRRASRGLRAFVESRPRPPRSIARCPVTVAAHTGCWGVLHGLLMGTPASVPVGGFLSILPLDRVSKNQSPLWAPYAFSPSKGSYPRHPGSGPLS